MILAACRCLDCDAQPVQARLFSHALVENTLGPYADCGQLATKLVVGGAGSPTPPVRGLRAPPLSQGDRRPRPGQRGVRPLGPAAHPTP